MAYLGPTFVLHFWNWARLGDEGRAVGVPLVFQTMMALV